MEKGWERTIPLIEIDNVSINKLFKGIHGFDGISNVSIIKEGCRTTNYTIESKSEKKYLLKIYYTNEQNSKGEQKLLNLLNNDINVQKIYKISRYSDNENIEYAIYDYIEGTTLAKYVEEGNVITEEIIKSVAYILAKLHSYKFDKVGFLDSNLKIINEMPPVTKWYSMSMGDNVKRRLGKDTINDINNLVKENENELLKLDNDSRLVHGDFQGTNILINNGEVSGVIDWEFAMAGHPIADIGQFFRYDKYFNDKHIKVFEDEYNNVSEYILPSNWYKIARIRDLINLIQLMDVKEDMPVKHKEIKRIINNTVNMFITE